MAGAPWRLIPYEDGVISIDVDGGITIDGVTTTPFPVEISDAVISSNGLIATWVDYDLRLARMARLPLDTPLSTGCSKGELRQTPASKMVAGAEWCHSIDAEPLAMDGDDEIIVFALREEFLFSTVILNVSLGLIIFDSLLASSLITSNSDSTML